jgi:hypothetical protein
MRTGTFSDNSFCTRFNPNYAHIRSACHHKSVEIGHDEIADGEADRNQRKLDLKRYKPWHFICRVGNGRTKIALYW